MRDSPYVHVACIRDIDASSGRSSTARAPIVFIHGFPDSSAMFSDYVSPEMIKESWLQKRSIFTLSFPNRQEHPHTPSLAELRSDILYRQFSEALLQIISDSPDGRICLVAHDWGAAYSWRFIREKGGQHIEKMVSLSVAPSQRFDVWEHGSWALAWSYQFFLALPFYFPASASLMGQALKRWVGYQGDALDHLDRDAYHYWSGLAWPLFAPLLLLGIKYKKPAFLDFQFPLLFIRAPIDRFLSTEEFEKALAERDDCRILVLPAGYSHWFPEQQSAVVIKELREFLAEDPPKKARSSATSKPKPESKVRGKADAKAKTKTKTKAKTKPRKV